MHATLALGQIFLVNHHQHGPQQILFGNKPKKKKKKKRESKSKHPTDQHLEPTLFEKYTFTKEPSI